MLNRGNIERKGAPHLMFVMVLLTLSASAMATPPSGPMSFASKLQNEGVTQ